MVRLSTRFGIYGPTDRLPYVGFRIVLAPETISLPNTPAPPSLIEDGKHYTIDELFEPSPYQSWDRYNKSLILKKAQTKFKELGLYQTAIDGDAGPSTQKALNQFQTDKRLPVTGRMDSATLAALQLAEETKKTAPPQGPWWVTRPNAPRSGDAEPPLSAYHGAIGRLRLIKDKDKGTLDQKEYRKFQ
ncbi:MAG: peptidoglycan-binding protein, partial [Verrucomicrobiae bacterium]|nr:peptidoglycan-binding protein [Verrucomicrobiae bacterium]